MPRVLLIAIAIGVVLYALVDWVAVSKRTTPGGLNRWAWLAVIVLLPGFGAAAWIISRLVERAEIAQGGPPPPAPRQRTTAPDDDAEFLSDLSRKIERRQRRTRGAPGEPGEGEADDRPADDAPQDTAPGAASMPPDPFADAIDSGEQGSADDPDASGLGPDQTRPAGSPADDDHSDDAPADNGGSDDSHRSRSDEA